MQNEAIELGACCNFRRAEQAEQIEQIEQQSSRAGRAAEQQSSRAEQTDENTLAQEAMSKFTVEKVRLVSVTGFGQCTTNQPTQDIAQHIKKRVRGIPPLLAQLRQLLIHLPV